MAKDNFGLYGSLDTTQFSSPGEGEAGYSNISGGMKLSDSLNKDVSDAKAAMQKVQSETGVKDTQQVDNFEAKGIRIGNQIIAQDNFDKVTNIQGNIIRAIQANYGQLSEAQTQLFSRSLNERLNKIKMALLKKGIEAEKEIANTKMSAEEAYQARQLISNFAGRIAGAVAGAYFGAEGSKFATSVASSQIGAGVGQTLGN